MNIHHTLAKAALIAAFFLAGCGGGGDTPSVHVGQTVARVNNASVGDAWVYADTDWHWPDPKGKWVVRGTTETPEFAPAPVWWYWDSSHPQGVPWWTLTNTPDGLAMHIDTPSEALYHGSFVNDVFTGSQVLLSSAPMVRSDLSVNQMQGDVVRVTVGVSMRVLGQPESVQRYVERNVAISPGFQQCPTDPRFSRCQNGIYYLQPGAGDFDVRASLRLTGMSEADIAKLWIKGLYIGVECFGHCMVDAVLRSYSVTI